MNELRLGKPGGEAAQAGCKHPENFTAFSPPRIAETATFSTRLRGVAGILGAVHLGMSVAFA